ncbi:hypothetical protein SK128_023873 [Halocaridina rubra]|uniref:Uncharacterized protein n=1 Tax=Halocaridina rubra TaxID=373956 RepID=A0AAN8XH29_HALRR
MDENQANDHPSSAKDSTPILPTKSVSGRLEVGSPSVSVSTTPTDDINITNGFANAQSIPHLSTESVRSCPKKNVQSSSSHSVEGHVNPSYKD